MSEYPENWDDIATAIKDSVDWTCVRCGHKHDTKTWHIMTVHHFDGDKSNCEWWNLIPLCQRCHLKIQARMNWYNTTINNCPRWMMVYLVGRIINVQYDHVVDFGTAKDMLCMFDILYESVRSWDEFNAEQTPLPGV